jgi:hypothetical protein
MALAFSVSAACSLLVDVEESPVTLDQTVAVPTGTGPATGPSVAEVVRAADGGRDVTLAPALHILSADSSARILAKEGPDRVGAVRGATLLIVSATYDGVDLAQTGPPTIVLGAHTLAPGVTAVDLDDNEVEALRVALLTPKALDLPISFTFHEPGGASGAVASSVHVRVVLQPILHVNIGRSW